MSEAAGVLSEWSKRLSSLTPGMVGGDLDRLVRTTRARSTQRRRGAGHRGLSPSPRTPAGGPSPPPPPQPPRLGVLAWQDAMGAVAVTVPRSLRGLDVASSGASGGGGGSPTWASVGGFSEAKRRLQRLVQWPWLHPEAFARMGVSAPAGALLHGPSGCGKSLVAQVLATECLANFLWVRSSELLSRWGWFICLCGCCATRRLLLGSRSVDFANLRHQPQAVAGRFFVAGSVPSRTSGMSCLVVPELSCDFPACFAFLVVCPRPPPRASKTLTSCRAAMTPPPGVSYGTRMGANRAEHQSDFHPRRRVTRSPPPPAQTRRSC